MPHFLIDDSPDYDAPPVTLDVRDGNPAHYADYAAKPFEAMAADGCMLGADGAPFVLDDSSLADPDDSRLPRGFVIGKSLIGRDVL